MLSSTPQYIIYITPTRVQIFNKGATISIFEYPENSVVYHEVVNTEELQKALREVLQTKKLEKGKAAYVLADKLVFHEELIEDDAKKREETIKQFFTYVPVAKEQILQSIFETKGKTYLFATNQKLFENVAAVFSECGIDTEAVIPARPFFGEKSEISDPEIESIFKNRQLLEKSNMVKSARITVVPSEEEIPAEKEESPEEKKKNVSGGKKKNILVLLICLLFLLAALGFAAYRFGFFPAMQEPAKVVGPTLTQQPTGIPSTPIPTVAVKAKAKEELTIHVLNGSGIPGQAAEVQEILANEGFENISVGTNDEEVDTTTITVTPEVSKQLQEELKTLMEESFASVDIRPASEAGEFDVTIITTVYSE